MPGNITRLLKSTRKQSDLASFFDQSQHGLTLTDGARVAVIGGGPAGSFFAYFLLKMAQTVDLQLSVDIYEPRFFSHAGPAGCNHCGGIVSESLVQLLAAEGINLPPTVVQRGIDSYLLHTDVGSVKIETPGLEKRIASVFRGNGPRHAEPGEVQSFDGHLLALACSLGATVVHKLVTGLAWNDGRPRVACNDGASGAYDLVAIASGVNSRTAQFLERGAPDYTSPATVKAFICEFKLGRDVVAQCLGTSMHVFLLDLPRLEFAALIPKGDFATLCMLGHDVDDRLVEAFLSAPEVMRCFPGSKVPQPACYCFPRVNAQAAAKPYADRMVWIGDCSVARLYKDGVGSAYRTAKAAARTAVFHGLAASDFERHFWPACKAIKFDNGIAKLVFAVTHLIQKAGFLRRGVLRMTAKEQTRGARRRHMSSVLWDVFTGSAPYKEVLLRSFHPEFPLMLVWNLVAANMPFGNGRRLERRSHEL